jgi:hypothetical protein
VIAMVMILYIWLVCWSSNRTAALVRVCDEAIIAADKINAAQR